jgi:cell division septum initiation protein DivIVA
MPEEHKAAEEFALLQELTEPLAVPPDDKVSEVLRTDFALTLRGYDRMAVDAYINRVTDLVRNIQAASSPEAAVRRALERVGGEVADILKRAHATAEEVTSTSRAEAEDRLQRARTEADEGLRSARTEAEQTLHSARKEATETLDRARAEAEQTVQTARAEAEQRRRSSRAEVEELEAAGQRRIKELDDEVEQRRRSSGVEVEELEAEGKQRIKEIDIDADRIWVERQRIIDDVRELAGSLVTLAESAAARFPADDEVVDEPIDDATADVSQAPPVLRAVGIVEPETQPQTESHAAPDE